MSTRNKIRHQLPASLVYRIVTSFAIVLLVALCPEHFPGHMTIVSAARPAFSASSSVHSSICAYLDSTQRLYSFGGYIGETSDDAKNAECFQGMISLDLSRAFSVTSPPMTDHGVLEPTNSTRCLALGSSLVLPDGQILIAGGRTVGPGGETPSQAIFRFDPMNATATKIQTAKALVPYRHSLPAAAAVQGSADAMYVIGGGDPLSGENVAWVYSITTGGATNVSGLPGMANVNKNGPEPRKLAALGRVNATHLFLSGGGSGGAPYRNDVWLFDTGNRSWSQFAYTMLNHVDQHRMIIYQDRYWIRVGGYSHDEPSFIVEYYDAVTNVTAKGVIVNPENGPLNVARGCLHLMNSTLVYLGGLDLERKTLVNKDDKNRRSVASIVRLLAIEPDPASSSGLQFRWITSYSPSVTSPSAPKTPSAAPSSAPLAEKSRAMGVGAILGIAAGGLGASILMGAALWKRFRVDELKGASQTTERASESTSFLPAYVEQAPETLPQRRQPSIILSSNNPMPYGQPSLDDPELVLSTVQQ
ncbi:hypothetical protein AMAG_09941 [Allomyces macrogynus ATCC 38327]|uniref:Kelch repeat protein n=1 Tax=Allomyces macrogynus (strain ATCC 38327) TaxID=578462 RepID=A0A0L0SPW9_ALLM3|nr:hypothetical protein AMAG_09941 [Allomyces macrogynus ATCC 38327]|eukprot:KNE64583.1 hypothetical protein AMAG_09941 [Allomyces macrogynus ATCC 38327]